MLSIIMIDNCQIQTNSADFRCKLCNSKCHRLLNRPKLSEKVKQCKLKWAHIKSTGQKNHQYTTIWKVKKIKLKNISFILQIFYFLFLFSYESEFLQKLVKDKKIHEARAFKFTYRYIDDVLSINNSRFAEFLPLIYPPELEVKEITDTASSASFLDLYLEFDDSGQISTKIYHKFSKYVQQYTSFSCIWCLHLAIDSLCKSQ